MWIKVGKKIRSPTCVTLITAFTQSLNSVTQQTFIGGWNIIEAYTIHMRKKTT